MSSPAASAPHHAGATPAATAAPTATPAAHPGCLPLLRRASDALARIELAAAGAALGAVCLLLLLNIVTRSAGHALFWVDEAAVAAMAWMAFLATSVSLNKRTNIAVTLAVDLARPALRRWLAVAVDAVLLGFALTLAVLVWRWFSPLDLLAAGGDPAAFAEATLNFMYEEPTQTLGVRKVWLWAILPLFAASACVHGLANLDASLAAARRGGR